MNTVAKGDEFEARCYTLIRDALYKGELGAIASQCQIFEKKAYYSPRRGTDIIFDLSIEVCPPNAERPVLLYLIECKDYESKIPINDVEEFENKVRQVAGLRVKGVFIAKNSFQSGAFNFAKSGDIMLIEAKEDGSYSILLHRTVRKKNDINIESGHTFNPDIDTELILFEKNIDALLKELFEHSLQIIEEENNKVEVRRLSRSNIEDIALDLIKSVDVSVISHHIRTPLSRIQKFLHDEYGLTVDILKPLEKDINGREVIGYCDLKNKLIHIDPLIIETERFAFLLAHEIGHFVLHSNLKIRQKYYETSEDAEFNYRIGRLELANERHWIEWQANSFAESLLMPKSAIIYKMVQFQLENGFPTARTGYMYYDNQTINIQDFSYAIFRLADFFGVNKTNIIYRLEHLSLIKYGNGFSTIGQIISKI